jgi:Uma2 family endonuclease
MAVVQSRWNVDPVDPRAPPLDVWERMTPEERAKVVAALPPDMPLDLHPPEGDAHRKPKERARDALGEFFRSIGRRIYLSSELVTYYPGEPRFCPDILAVLDVEDRERSSWVVAAEGKGLDLVIEILVGGDRKKDLDANAAFYARLGVREYFVFDRPRGRVVGHRLRPGGKAYERVVPQAGRTASEVLGLDLTIEDGTLRFYHGTAPLLFLDELLGKLRAMVAELVDARDAALRRAEEEAKRAEEEAKRAEDFGRENEELRAELARLRKER